MSDKRTIYLDYNATTPVDDQVLEAMLPYFNEKFGNAASHTHAYGWTAEAAVDLARQKVATLIGASPEEIVFTSGATEAINLGLKGVWEAELQKNSGAVRNEIVTVATEHKAVLDTCRFLETKGAKVTYLPVNSDGLPDIEKLKSAVSDKTLLVCVMHANNETGVIQPLEHIAEIAHQSGAYFMCDATQSVGKIEVKVGGSVKQDSGIDILAFSSHKMYGPKGVGALYVRRKNPRVNIITLLHGGGHEHNLRSGTLNVPGIVGLGKACEIAGKIMKDENERMQKLRNSFLTELADIGGVKLNGEREALLPHVINVSIEGVKADKLMSSLPGLAFASGSACTSADPRPSHVLQAMGLTVQQARSSVRFSLGRGTTKEELAHAKDQLIEKIKKQRNVEI